MNNTLIKVSRGANSQSFALKPTDLLSQIRSTLTDAPNSFMTNADSFLNNGSPIQNNTEYLIPLSSIIGSENSIEVGTGNTIRGDASIHRYNELSEPSKRTLLENIQLRRGFTVGVNGFQKTFKNLYSWRNDRLPDANMPRILTYLEGTYSFTKETFSLETSGVESGSVTLSTPYGDGSANFEHAKTHSETGKEVVEYMTQRYICKKVDLRTSSSDIRCEPQFLEAVKAAVKNQERSLGGYESLVGVLNEWGWYVPLQYTLGGVIYATKQESISEYSEAESESEKFGGEFKATFGDFGGGAAYENSSGTKSSSSRTDVNRQTQLLQIGGKAGTINSFKEWNESLHNAVNWNTVTFQKMYPSLMLLSGESNDTLTSVSYLLQKYSRYSQVSSLQPYIDVSAYELHMAELLNPFS